MPLLSHSIRPQTPCTPKWRKWNKIISIPINSRQIILTKLRTLSTKEVISQILKMSNFQTISTPILSWKIILIRLRMHSTKEVMHKILRTSNFSNKMRSITSTQELKLDLLNICELQKIR